MAKSIYSDIKDLALPDNIKEQANNIFQQMKICKRKDRRKLVIFACIFFAHKELRKTIDPQYLLSMMNLRKNDGVKALKICREFMSGYRPPDYTFTVYDFIDYHLELLGICRGKENIHEFARQILQHDSALEDVKPQYLSHAIIYEYFYIFNHHALLNNLKNSRLKCPSLVFSILKAHIEEIYRSMF